MRSVKRIKRLKSGTCNINSRSMNQQFPEKEKEGGWSFTLVAFTLISDILFLNTFIRAFASARSPAKVEVACALM